MNILVADDHEVTRRGIKEILHDAFDDLEIYEVADFASIYVEVPKRSWSLLILDILMPGNDIVEVLKWLRTRDKNVPILVVTAVPEVEYVLQVMRAGANGVIHKHRAAQDLLTAIQHVIAGKTYLHAETAVEVASALHEKEAPLPHESLSHRELEIFRLIALGHAIKEIAAILGLSDKTVATYLTRIREKTNLNSHVDIARYAIQHGIVD